MDFPQSIALAASQKHWYVIYSLSFSSKYCLTFFFLTRGYLQTTTQATIQMNLTEIMSIEEFRLPNTQKWVSGGCNLLVLDLSTDGISGYSL